MTAGWLGGSAELVLSCGFVGEDDVVRLSAFRLGTGTE